MTDTDTRSSEWEPATGDRVLRRADPNREVGTVVDASPIDEAGRQLLAVDFPSETHMVVVSPGLLELVEAGTGTSPKLSAATRATLDAITEMGGSVVEVPGAGLARLLGLEPPPAPVLPGHDPENAPPYRLIFGDEVHEGMTLLIEVSLGGRNRLLEGTVIRIREDSGCHAFVLDVDGRQRPFGMHTLSLVALKLDT